jgi:hypothetical protein
MSLWSTNLTELTIEQLNEFLQMNLPEGDRLDYKVDLPSDLGKTIAAFANTYGGIIIVGVDEKGPDNRPVWPSVRKDHLLEEAPRIFDRIHNIAKSIYPPVPVTVSKVLPNPHAGGKCLLVVRVDESREAPHASPDKEGVRFYMSERTVASSDRILPANFDRIERLLARRSEVERRRDQAITNCRHDLSKLFNSGAPKFWFTATPYFPWRPIIDRDSCLAQHKVAGGGFEAHPVPNGSRQRTHTPRPGVLWVSEARTSGLMIFASELQPQSETRRVFNLTLFAYLLRQASRFVSSMLSRCVEKPGGWLVQVDVDQVAGMRLEFFDGLSHQNHCQSDGFVVERYVDVQEIATGMTDRLEDMTRELCFGLGCDADSYHAKECKVQVLRVLSSPK